MVQRVCKDRELYALQRVHKFKFAAGPIRIRCLLDGNLRAVIVYLYVTYPSLLSFR